MVSHQSLQLHRFMHYPDMGCRLAMMPLFEWSGRRLLGRQTRVQYLWFLFGYFNLVYQNIGMIIYLYVASQPQTELGDRIAQISETCSIMGLTIVGACNMWMLQQHRPEIERLIEQLQLLYPKQSSIHRVAHYYNKSNNLMKYTVIFFKSAFVYYNVLPIVELFYELLSTTQQVQYKYQSNTWYPWQLFPSRATPFGFVAAYICQLVSSLTGVGYIMASEFLLCFFVTQMRLHFDALANGLSAMDARQVGAKAQLKKLIAYHIRLLEIAKHIDRIFNTIFLVNFATSTIAICLMGFSMIMISVFFACKYCVGLMTFLVFTLFICVNGSQFTSASDKLLPAAFYSDWYNGDMAYRKMLCIFMMRSSKSSVLRAYQIIPVSMGTFMAILKFSYQLFTFVRAMA